jgi:hypothetical protein
MSYVSSFVENSPNYNFSVAIILGLLVIVLIIGFILGRSRGKRTRRRPE